MAFLAVVGFSFRSTSEPKSIALFSGWFQPAFWATDQTNSINALAKLVPLRAKL